jgi:hypothetical protein
MMLRASRAENIPSDRDRVCFGIAGRFLGRILERSSEFLKNVETLKII